MVRTVRFGKIIMLVFGDIAGCVALANADEMEQGVTFGHRRSLGG